MQDGIDPRGDTAGAAVPHAPLNGRPSRDSPTDRHLEVSSVSADTLPRQVARRVVEAILRGRFESGQSLLSTGEFAREFDVSRPVVREALGIVAGLGLIESHQGRQARVHDRSLWNDLSPELLQARLKVGLLDDILPDCLELRRVVETEAAYLAALRASSADIGAMGFHLERLGASVDDPTRYTTHDVAFHDSILRATGNRLFLLLIGQMRQLLDVARAVSATSRSGLIPDSQVGHRAIYDAIAAGDEEGARAAMQDHLRWAEETNVANQSFDVHPQGSRAVRNE